MHCTKHVHIRLVSFLFCFRDMVNVSYRIIHSYKCLSFESIVSLFLGIDILLWLLFLHAVILNCCLGVVDAACWYEGTSSWTCSHGRYNFWRCLALHRTSTLPQLVGTALHTYYTRIAHVLHTYCTRIARVYVLLVKVRKNTYWLYTVFI